MDNRKVYFLLSYSYSGFCFLKTKLLDQFGQLLTNKYYKMLTFRMTKKHAIRALLYELENIILDYCVLQFYIILCWEAGLNVVLYSLMRLSDAHIA